MLDDIDITESKHERLYLRGHDESCDYLASVSAIVDYISVVFLGHRHDDVVELDFHLVVVGE